MRSKSDSRRTLRGPCARQHHTHSQSNPHSKAMNLGGHAHGIAVRAIGLNDDRLLRGDRGTLAQCKADFKRKAACGQGRHTELALAGGRSAAPDAVSIPHRPFQVLAGCKLIDSISRVFIVTLAGASRGVTPWIMIRVVVRSLASKRPTAPSPDSAARARPPAPA